ncbi:MAG: urea ABC transporter permease subunit UrtC [Burkholderiaceae bacterium]|nr:urea ABC transporter permease subunit UrtC [Burkholderiaceae bacterium]
MTATSRQPRAAASAGVGLVPPRVRLFSPLQWTAILAVFLAAGVVVPVLHATLPQDSPFWPDSYAITLLGKFTCYAMVAVAMDLIWGYTGILSLGQSLFFALGGYAFGMYLMRGIGREGQYGSHLPDFMVFLDWKDFPWHWAGTDHFAWALFLVVAAPGLLAFVFGYFAFRSRIKGVYFSIITQALTFAFMLLFFRNETGFGGNNGFTDFKTILGWRITEPATKATILAVAVLALLLVLVGSRWLVAGKFGRILQAIRDSESRLRFCGYDTLGYKLSVWTLAAVISGLAGALYVPIVGIINPSEMSPASSIEVAIWTAVGGRGTLLGPILGAFLVNGAKSFFTMTVPDYWLFFLGLLFVLVTMFLPRGIYGSLAAWQQARREARPGAPVAAGAVAPAAADPDAGVAPVSPASSVVPAPPAAGPVHGPSRLAPEGGK